MEKNEMKKYEDGQMIPYVVFEKEQARSERKEKRLITIIIVLIISFSAYAFFNTFDVEATTTTSTQEVEGGSANIVNGEQFNDTAVRNDK